jgi:hypothetical protein
MVVDALVAFHIVLLMPLLDLGLALVAGLFCCVLSVR